MNQKGQGALDFLMTYGWTILAALVSIAAFWQFGLLSGGFMSAVTGMSYCALPAGIVCEDHSIGPSGVTLVLRNALPSAITSVKVRIQSQESGVVCLESTTVAQIASGAKHSFFVACDGLQNRQRFKGSIVVTYGIEGGVLSHTDEGSVASGQIEPSQICNVDNDGDTFYQVGSCPAANDCDDNDPTIPLQGGVHEDTEALCTDDKDNDCDGLTDEADPDCDLDLPCQTNADGDPYISILCESGTDCDDSNSTIHPPQEYENTVPLCTDLVDDDCDGLIDYPTDPSCIGAGTCTVDIDGDGYYLIGSCISGDDCNDDPEVCGAFCHPGLAEDCSDEFDNDCNDLINDGCPPSPSCTGVALECPEINSQIDCESQYNCNWDFIFHECYGSALDCENSFFSNKELCETQQTEMTCPLFEGPCTDRCVWNDGQGGGDLTG
ncbi:MAG TPA: hypothetical protein VJH20_04485 [Candidatus Nanoarchaeia archaeon]|nr:hypothetical protein [Candidatus Nanoarchaeia archaeon]